MLEQNQDAFQAGAVFPDWGYLFNDWHDYSEARAAPRLRTLATFRCDLRALDFSRTYDHEKPPPMTL